MGRRNQYLGTYQLDMRPRFTTIKPLTAILTESGAGLHNGLIPLLAEESVMTNLMAMLQRAESSSSSVTPEHQGQPLLRDREGHHLGPRLKGRSCNKGRGRARQ